MRVLAGEAWSFQRYVENHFFDALRDVLHPSSISGYAHGASGRREAPRLRESLRLDDPLFHGSRVSGKRPPLTSWNEWMWPILGVPDLEAKPGMRLSLIECGGNRAADAFEEARTTPAPSPNPTDPKAIGPGIRAAVKCAVQAELKRHRGAPEPEQDGPPGGGGGGKKGGRSKNNTP